MAPHTESQSFQCGQCPKTYDKQILLLVHGNKRHKGKEPFSCDKCDKVFNNLLALKNHVETIHHKIKHQCQFCDRTFTQIATLDIHMKEKHAEEMVEDENVPKASGL